MLTPGLAVKVCAAGLLSLCAVTICVQAAAPVSGEGYPNKPIRVVTSEVGGSADLIARVFAQSLASRLGQPLVVDSRGGVATIPGDIVAKARPDGYTLLVSAGTLWTTPLMSPSPYDAVKDFAPVTLTNRSVLLLTMHPSVPARSVAELVAYCKARPGQLSYASSGTGAASHLAGELFKSMAGINIVRIPYKGSGVAVNDLLSGRVQLAFYSATSVIPHIKSGKLIALAVTSGDPSVLFPGLPTVAESGLPGYEATQMYGVFAPAGTSASLVNRLSREFLNVLEQPEVKEKFLNAGLEIAGSGPQDLALRMKSEISRLGKVIRDAGIRID